MKLTDCMPYLAFWSSILIVLTLFTSIKMCSIVFIKTLCVCSSNEVGLHIENPASWIHQVLVTFSLNLDNSHDHSINHVNTLTFLLHVLALCVWLWLIFKVLGIQSFIICQIFFLTLILNKVLLIFLKFMTIVVRALNVLRVCNYRLMSCLL